MCICEKKRFVCIQYEYLNCTTMPCLSYFYVGGWYNLTSNLFTLIIPLTTHNNTSDICSYKPYTEKKRGKKIY